MNDNGQARKESWRSLRLEPATLKVMLWLLRGSFITLCFKKIFIKPHTSVRLNQTHWQLQCSSGTLETEANEGGTSAATNTWWLSQNLKCLSNFYTPTATSVTQLCSSQRGKLWRSARAEDKCWAEWLWSRCTKFSWHIRRWRVQMACTTSVVPFHQEAYKSVA